MIILRRGNRLPTVAVFQSFLVQGGEVGNDLAIDGIFGAQTQAAVRAYQRKLGLHPTGVVSYDLWRGTVGSHRQIIDSVDLTDTNIRDDEDLVPYGQTVIRRYGMCRGIFDDWNEILRQGQIEQVVLLRFHGHGSPGSMNTSSGTLGDEGSELSYEYGAKFDSFLARLRPLFAPYGSIEMHGCRVGRGRRGITLLQRMANAIQDPVTAALGYQYGGGTDTFEFEGPTRTVCPNGLDLKSWASNKCAVSYGW